MSIPSVIDIDAVRTVQVSRYDFSYGSNFLREDAIADLRNPCYLTVDEVLLRGRFKTLIEELEGPKLSEALSHKFARNLHSYPRLTTIMRRSQAKILRHPYQWSVHDHDRPCLHEDCRVKLLRRLGS